MNVRRSEAEGLDWGLELDDMDSTMRPKSKGNSSQVKE